LGSRNESHVGSWGARCVGLSTLAVDEDANTGPECSRLVEQVGSGSWILLNKPFEDVLNRFVVINVG
jgi:hypothetical protein